MNEVLASRALVIFSSLVAAGFFRNVVLCGFLQSSVLVSSVQLPTSMSNNGRTWDNAKKDISSSEHVTMVLTLRANMLMTLFLPRDQFFIICHVHAVRT